MKALGKCYFHCVVSDLVFVCCMFFMKKFAMVGCWCYLCLCLFMFHKVDFLFVSVLCLSKAINDVKEATRI